MVDACSVMDTVTRVQILEETNAFHITQIREEKEWIQLFYLQLGVNS